MQRVDVAHPENTAVWCSIAANSGVVILAVCRLLNFMELKKRTDDTYVQQKTDQHAKDRLSGLRGLQHCCVKQWCLLLLVMWLGLL